MTLADIAVTIGGQRARIRIPLPPPPPPPPQLPPLPPAPANGTHGHDNDESQQQAGDSAPQGRRPPPVHVDLGAPEEGAIVRAHARVPAARIHPRSLWRVVQQLQACAGNLQSKRCNAACMSLHALPACAMERFAAPRKLAALPHCPGA